MSAEFSLSIFFRDKAGTEKDRATCAQQMKIAQAPTFFSRGALLRVALPPPKKNTYGGYPGNAISGAAVYGTDLAQIEPAFRLIWAHRGKIEATGD